MVAYLNNLVDIDDANCLVGIKKVLLGVSDISMAYDFHHNDRVNIIDYISMSKIIAEKKN